MKIAFFAGPAGAAFCAAVLASASALAGSPGPRCASIDLHAGTSSTLPPQASFVVAPMDFNNDGYYETVLKLTLMPGDARTAVLEVTYDGDAMGNTLNIGDSPTNDGGSGDAATQSNDAEMQIGRQADTSRGFIHDPSMQVFGRDGYPIDPVYGPALALVPEFVKAGDTIRLQVADGLLTYSNPATPQGGVLKSTWLYALAGQPDTEGPVNYDVYAAFNRVIYDPGLTRLGQGVSMVRLCIR